jgi:hypothetical protein
MMQHKRNKHHKPQTKHYMPLSHTLTFGVSSLHTNLWCLWFTHRSNSNFACSTCKLKRLYLDTTYALESKLNMEIFI